MSEHISQEQSRSREYLVKRRLAFVRKLGALKENFKDMDEVILLSDSGWTHPYQDYLGLRYYLLLTCFDILGQPHQWVSFTAWIEKKKNVERDEILKQYCLEDHLTVTRKLNACYNALYGTKNSFYRFINEVITPDRRCELMSSIYIVKVDKSSKQELPYEPREKEKSELLFRMRNSYTHTGHPMASGGNAIMRNGEDVDEDGILFDGQLLFGQAFIHAEEKDGYSLHYRVRRWPKLLEEIIEEVLASRH